MSLNANELVRLVKRAAVEAVMAGGPMGVCFGTVTSASPIKIMVDQKKTLTDAQLILTNNVRDFAVEMTTEGGQERQKLMIHLGLKPGEKVILLRCDGGQKFIVLDRWGALG